MNQVIDQVWGHYLGRPDSALYRTERQIKVDLFFPDTIWSCWTVLTAAVGEELAR